jgi:hypothetical protein
MVKGRRKGRAKRVAQDPPRERVVAVLDAVARHLVLQPWARDLGALDVAEALHLGHDEVSHCLTWCEERGMVTSSPHPESPDLLRWRATRQGFAFLVEVLEGETPQT